MNKSFNINVLKILLCIPLFTFTSCFSGSSSDDKTTAVYTNKNIPATYKVEFPASLTNEGTSQRHMKSIKKSDGEGGSFGYFILKDMISKVEDQTDELEIELMILDAALDQLSGMVTADNVSLNIDAGDISVTWTQEMANKEAELFAKWGYEPSSDEITPAGTQLPCPRLSYTRDLADTDSDGYNHSITYYYDETSDGTKYVGSYTIKWNNKKTKMLISDQYTESYTSNNETFTCHHSQKQIYDNSDGKARMNVAWTDTASDSEEKITFNFKETGENNGVLIDASYSETFIIDGIASINFSYTIEGLADDNGGYVKTAYSSDSGKSYYNESFNGDGNITGAQFSYDGATFTDIPDYGTYDAGNYDDEYESGSGADATTLTVTGGSTTEGTTYFILPQGTSTTPPSADNEDEIYQFNAGVIGIATYSAGEWQVDYWGTESQITGTVIFSVTISTGSNEVTYSYNYEPAVGIIESSRK